MTAYVVTFYSFKGGVGRTTLLVNIAHVLASRGERVLIWDLDLEAPGVHQFPGLEPPDPLWQAGFLEWLGDTPACPTPEPPEAWPSAEWIHLLGERVYEPRGQREAGRILVLPAHGTNAKLGRAYAEVDWNGLFVEHPAHGLHLLTQVRDALIERFAPTFLFIDSRTGISDLGGFLTGFLPDCTVLVGNYSRQSTEGLRGVYLALDRFATERVKTEPYRQRRLERVLVASPVPSAPSGRDLGRKRWAEGFAGEAPRSSIEVPLVENLLYAEDILVRSAPSSDAARAYRAVADALVGLRQLHGRIAAARPPAAEGEARVARVLELLGFDVTTNRTDQGFDLLARQRLPLGNDLSYAVIYKHAWSREALRSLRVPSGYDAVLVVADAIRPDLRSLVQSLSGVTLRTVAELEDQLIDLRACTTVARQAFEDSELSRVYVAPRLAVAGGDAVDALDYVMTVLEERRARRLVIRGDRGSGKTSVLRRVAYELALRAERQPDAPVPVLVELPRLSHTTTLESVVYQHLNAALGWHGNPAALLYLLAAGRLIILLDGFDEAAAESPEAAAEQLRQLTVAADAPGASRIVVACGSEPLPVDAVVVDLSPFSGDQIDRFLDNRVGPKAARGLREELHGAGPVAPMVLELLASSGASSKAPLAAVFERYVERWVLGDRDDAVSPAVRARMIEVLAAELWKRSIATLGAPQLAAALRAADTPASVDDIDRTLRTAPFLTRTNDGMFGFAHRSVHGYVLARHLVYCAQIGAAALRSALKTERLDPGCAEMFAALTERNGVARAVVRTLADGTYRADVSENAVRLAAAFD